MSSIFLLGDAGLDIYHVGQVRGLSAEAPSLILDQVDSLELPGMALNVFMNLQSLGVDVTAQFPSHLSRKHRIMTESGQLLRIDVEDYCEPYESLDIPDDTELIVVSGYGKGSVDLEVIEFLNSLNLPMLIDTKSDPWPWIVSADRVVLFPNALEYSKYQSSYDWFPQIVVKRSELGADDVRFGEVQGSYPSLVERVECVNGAGDTFLAGYLAALTALESISIESVMLFANAAAANVVEQNFSERTTTLDAIAERLSLDEV